MEKQKLLELIDRNLLGIISHEDKEHLHHLMASDPKIAEQVTESQQAFDILKAELNRQLRERLKQMDRDISNKPRILLRWVKTGVLLIIVFVLSWFWASDFYSNTSIAVRFAELDMVDGQGILNYQEPLAHLAMANTAFRNKDFEQAIPLYLSWVQETAPDVNYYAQWNLLLARFALQGPTADLKLEMESFSENAPDPLKSKSGRLLKLLDSAFYKLFFIPLQENLSPLKPRLI